MCKCDYVYFVCTYRDFLFYFSAFVYFLPNIKKPVKVKSRRQKEKDKSHTSNIKYSNILLNVGSSLKQSVLELYTIEWSKYWNVFIFKGLVGFAMGVYYSNYALYLKTQYMLSPKYVGYVISFQGIIGSLCSYFISYINMFYKTDHDFSQRNFHVFLLLSASLLGMIMSSNVIIYILWLIPLAMGNAISRLVTLEMILKRCDSEHRGTLIGAANSVRSLSGVVAPMTAGCIGQYVGVPYVIYASFFSTFIGSIMSYNLRKNIQERRLKQE